MLDIPCPIAFDFLVRDGKLEMTTMMRSQSVAMVLPYDLMLMTLLGEYVSIKIGKSLGKYTHFCVSAHIYEDEIDLSKKIVKESPLSVNLMPQMEEADFFPEILSKIAIIEENKRSCTNRGIISFQSPFWNYLGKIFGWQVDQKV